MARVDPSSAIQALEEEVRPVLEHSADWAFEVGLGITSLSALYYLVLKLLDS